LGLGDTGIGVEVDLLVFEAAPQPLDEDVVRVAAPRLRGGRLLPSMLMVIAWRFRVSVKSSLVNWLPPASRGQALVDMISGLRYWESASSSASTQNSAPSVFDSRHASTARLTQSIITTR